MELCNIFFITAPIKPSPINFKKLPSFKCFSSSESTHRVKLSESLQEETLQILEWPAVCNQISAFTSTTMAFSAARDGRVPIGKSPAESQRLLDQTSAAFALPRLPDFSGIEDVSGIVETSVSGQLLTIREICAVKRTLESARALFEELKEMSSNSNQPERYYHLLEVLQKCKFDMELEQRIGFCIDCKLSVILDRASDDLEIIRSERKENMDNLDSLLKEMSTKIYQAGGIDSPLVTRRRSRMCVGIKSSSKSLLPDGVILDVSSSGATYYMEPKEAVDLNNMEIRLSNAEKIEEQAILGFLTSDIAESETDIKYLLDRIREVDFAIARAAHARWMNGVCPVLSPSFYENIKSNDTGSLSISIDGIQHPLLLESSLKSLSDILASKSRNSAPWCERNGVMNYKFSDSLSFPVPIDIKVEHGTRVVVISGPNTGGKTASMKTLALASVMVKAGMYLPARNYPRLPWFDLILADIGDQQSLEQSLSTFSGHLSRICKILKVASEDSLILIDEIGSGTDPSEGVALSASLLGYLKDRVNLAVVTTHYADLSLLKERDSRFENAAMEFSLETLQPTYRILWGSSGESNALSIAKSIGFDEKIVEHAQMWAKRLMPEKAEKRRSLLYQSLMEERNKLEAQAERAASVHSDAMILFYEIQDEAEDLGSREAALKAKETQLIQRELIGVKSHIEKIVKDFETQIRNTSFDQINALLKESESAISSIVEAHGCTEELSAGEADRLSDMAKPGQQVLVKGLGNKLATIVEAPVDDDTVLVQYGKIRVRVSVSNIRALPSSDATTAANSHPHFKKQDRRIKGPKNLPEAGITDVGSYGPVLQTTTNTLDLRGMRVEEASYCLNLSISTFDSNSVLFIIHGMGTGALKECVMEVLRKHPRIAKFEQESPMNYGCTIAYIE